MDSSDPDWRWPIEEGGLSQRAARLLGFDQMCQCGHDYGSHAGAPGTECVVLDCPCGCFQHAQDR
jgi:hypothetical protein